MKKIFTTTAILFTSAILFSQNIAVNTDGTTGDAGVMLDVKGTNPLTTTAIQNVFQIKSYDASGLKMRMILGTNSTVTNTYGGMEVYDVANSTYRALALQPNGGNVGVGTTAPQDALHIVSTIPNSTSNLHPYRTGFIVEGDQNTFGGRISIRQAGLDPSLSLFRTNGTIAAPTPLLSGDVMGKVAFGGYDGSVVNSCYGLTAVASENWTTAGHGTDLAFYTINTGSSSFGGTEKMRITSNGNVGINQTAPVANLEVDGSSGSTIKIVDGNQTAGYVLASDANGQGKWTNPSTLSSSGGCSPKSQVFTSSGTFTVTAGTFVMITACGGGGGGGGGGSGGTTENSGAGGGGGAESYFYYPIPCTNSEVWTITVGAAGTAGAVNTNGGNGGTTTIVGSISGTIISASGGSKGNKGGTSSSSTFVYGGAGGNGGGGGAGSGGAGGDYSGGPIEPLSGGSVTPGCNYAPGAGGGGGEYNNNYGNYGASGGSVVPKLGGSASYYYYGGGGGGSSLLGTGGNGAGSNNAAYLSTAGSGYGAGGGGGCGSSGAYGGTSKAGSAGSTGVVIIYYWQ